MMASAKSMLPNGRPTRPAPAAQVGGGHAVFQRAQPGVVDPGRHLGLADVHQHHHRAQQQAAGVGNALARDVGRAAVDGLEHGHVFADVGAARQAHAAGHLGRDVAQDVAVQVGRDDHVEQLGPGGQPCCADVDDHVIGLDLRVFDPNLVENPVEQAIGHLHDVVLGHAGDLARPLARAYSKA
jgi:hypothetical protein